MGTTECNERITVYLCGCCGKVVTPFVQPALMPNRPGTMMLECHTWGCKNWKRTKDSRDNVAEWYTAVSVDAELAARMIEIVEMV